MGETVRHEFWTNGFVIIRQALPVGHLNAIRDEVDAYLTAAAAPVTEVAAADSDAGRYVYGHAVLAWADAFAAALRDGPLVPGIQRALGCDGPLTLLDDQVYVKEPGTHEVTPWHQDASYWATSGRELCTAWLALDPVTADTGGLEFVVGSHLWERAYRAPAFTAGQLVGDPADPAVPADSEIREQHVVAAPDIAAGDAVVFHATLLHGAGPNLSADLRRRALVTRWAGADVRFEPREYSSARQVAKAERNGVRAGEPFGGPEYPRYQAAGLDLEREHAQ